MSLLNRFGASLRKAAELVLTLDDGDASADLTQHLGALFRLVLAGDGLPTEADYEAVRFALRNRPPQEAAALINAMRTAGPLQAAELSAMLNTMMAPAERQAVIHLALGLGIGAGRQKECRAVLLELAQGIGMSGEAFAEMETQLLEAESRRRKLLRSGAGIAVVLIIILIFILTATLLRSVIFGLIGAYVMLPVEKFFERKLARPGTFLYRAYQFCSLFIRPLAALASKLQRGRRELSGEEKAQKEYSALVARAVTLTTLTLLAVFVGGTLFLTSLSSRYVQGWQAARAAKKMETVQAAAPAERDGKKIKQVELDLVPRGVNMANRYLDQLRARFDETPLVRNAIAAVSRLLTDEATQQEVMKFFLRRTGGVFAFTANLLGTVCGVLADLLLTVFFFLLFLTKLAEYRSAGKGGGWQEEYLVRTVFRSAWLPGAGEGTLLEAQRILSEIFNRLKVWVKGYLTLVLVDATVYSTIFWCLNVPYFFVLGVLAGCGLLLPYIGPIVSCCLTLLVTLAAGGDAVSSGMLLGILAAYLIYNGVIEQFILYPMVIGESLGLTALETIIVVLLGAIFAGIAGMLFAIPAASVLKYLVPQIYHCFDRRKEDGV